MKKLKKELAANLIAIKCPWGLGRSYLGKLLPTVIYTARYSAAYTPPPGTTQGQRRANHDAHSLHCRALDDVFYAELGDPVEGVNAVKIQDLFDHIKVRSILSHQLS